MTFQRTSLCQTFSTLKEVIARALEKITARERPPSIFYPFLSCTQGHRRVANLCLRRKDPPWTSCLFNAGPHRVANCHSQMHVRVQRLQFMFLFFSRVLLTTLLGTKMTKLKENV